MPRFRPTKTKKSARRRFKITGTGKVMSFGAGRRHLMRGKSAKRMRRLRKATAIAETDAHRVKMALPFGA